MSLFSTPNQLNLNEFLLCYYSDQNSIKRFNKERVKTYRLISITTFNLNPVTASFVTQVQTAVYSRKHRSVTECTNRTVRFNQSQRTTMQLANISVYLHNYLFTFTWRVEIELNNRRHNTMRQFHHAAAALSAENGTCTLHFIQTQPIKNEIRFRLTATPSTGCRSLSAPAKDWSRFQHNKIGRPLERIRFW